MEPNINKRGAEGAHPFQTRFADAPWFKQITEEEALIIGSGGIGSNLAFALSSTGLRFTIVDDDQVGSENIGAQFFKGNQIGNSKVSAIKANCMEYLGPISIIDTIEGRYDNDFLSNPIVFLGLDNMATRKLAFEKWVTLMEESDNKDDFILIDSRLLMEKYQIFVVTKDTIEQYRRTLFGDEEVEEASCTAKATRFASWGLVSDIVAVFANWCTNKAFKDEVREVPFSIEKMFDCFYYKVI